MLLDSFWGMWMSCAVTEEPPTVPGLSHVVCVGGPDHDESNVSQSHQQVLTSTRLPISATPFRLSARRMENEKKLVSNIMWGFRFRLTILPYEQWITPLWRSQWQFVGHVGEAWSEKSVPGRCRFPGEPHLADRQSPASFDTVQSVLCREAPRHRPSPGSNMVKREAHLKKTG